MSETRALSAALSGPAFVTRGGGSAMRAATRHVERWAPESGAKASAPMRSLGFVDRLVSPWIQTAQRSASMRLFAQYASLGMSEREGNAVSWVFPRPWYQDELDWMAAARQAPKSEASGASPALFTTRGTYVTPARAAVVMPSALYEYVAPSLSVASPLGGSMVGGMNGISSHQSMRGDAYSPLVSLAAVQAAELMSRAVAPVMMPRMIRGDAASSAATANMASSTLANPALRRVLASLLARAQQPADAPISRLAASAPELVTPPSPRAGEDAPTTTGASQGYQIAAAAGGGGTASAPAAAREEQLQVLRIAQQVAEQRARVTEVTRVAHQAAQREVAARAEVARVESAHRAAAESSSAAAATASAASATANQHATVVASAQAAEAELRARTSRTGAERASQQAQVDSVQAQQQARIDTAQAAVAQQTASQQTASQQTVAHAQAQAERARQIQVERANIEERIAQRVAERTGATRLHEQARLSAAHHARTLELAQPAEPVYGRATPGEAQATPTSQVPAAVVAAMAALPPELATYLAAQASRAPGGAMQAFSELGDALRTVELMARASSSGARFEATRGPRLMMPAGLGGLVAGVDRAQAVADRPAMLTGAGPRHINIGEGLAATVQAHAASSGLSQSRRTAPTIAMTHVASGSSFGARAETSSAPTSALAAAVASPPAALAHVAWADRWLARFAGASQQSLDTLAAGSHANPAMRLSALLATAPDAVFVAPTFDTARDSARVRFDAEGRVHVTAASGMPALASSLGASAGGGSAGGSSAGSSQASSASASSTARPAFASQSSPQATPVLRPVDTRVDDSAEISDDVFAAIAAAAASNRSARMTPSPAATAAAAARASSVPQLVHLDPDRYGAADMLAHLAPGAPGSGLSAGLASSPFAAALRHVLPLAAAQSFDVRSLFGSGIASTYLAGLLDPATHEISIAGSSISASTFGFGGLGAMGANALATFAGTGGQLDEAALGRGIPGFDATYVSPDGSTDPGTIAGREGAGAGEPGTQAAITSGATAGLAPDVIRALQQATAAGGGTASLTTLRSALLSWQVDSGPAGVSTSQLATVLGPTAQLAGASSASGMAALAAGLAPSGGARDGVAITARQMLDAMTQPLLGDGSVGSPYGDEAAYISRTAPGMFAERAQHFAVEQERSTADLSFDFVSPELVLAARVYGLGPAEAAQAARLALAGPGQLAAMAGAVDRTFVQAMAMDAERRAHGASAAGSYGSGSGSGSTSSAPSAARTRDALAAAVGYSPSRTDQVAVGASLTGSASAASAASAASSGELGSGADGSFDAFAGLSGLATPGASSFGVQRRSPRGAFLWPAATVAALNLNAAGSDGAPSSSIAALELLAAQAVAELGTFTALGLDHIRDNAGDLQLSESAQATLASAGATSAGGSATGAGGSAAGDEVRAGAPARTAGRPVVGQPGELAAEPPESDVLAAAVALMPQARRSRFEALYVALGQSAAGRDWSPAARAARALALAGRSEDGTTASARERAAMAWDVLPIVYADSFHDEEVVASRGGGMSSVSARSGRAPEMTAIAGGSRSSVRRGERGSFDSDRPALDVRPGLGSLSARAGEALGAYVTPTAASSSYTAPGSATSAGSQLGVGGAIRRVPTAAQEMVQTGRAAGGRFGGGEVEIPSWFESAAKRMFSDRSASASDGISMSDLTLISSAPSKAIAASDIAPARAAPIAPSHHEVHTDKHDPIDVESVAGDVYKHIMTMMDSARARNGEPFL